jgi:broad specificity phosphatase PhoE
MQTDEMVRRVLAWIRHGEYAQPAGVPSAHLPYGLTPRGREQARAAARAVWQFAQEQQLQLDVEIDTSRLRRAWETAQLLSEELERMGVHSTLAQFDELAERALGSAANLTVDEIEAVLASDPRFEAAPRGWKRDASYVLPLPGAESLEQAGRRVARHVLARMRVARAGLKLFVGHGGAFRHAARELGLLQPAQVAELSMVHGAPIYFDYRGDGASVQFTHTAGQWRQRSEAAPLD